HRIRLILANQQRQGGGYQLRVVEGVPTPPGDRGAGPPRPHPLGPGWDAPEAVRRLAADPDRPAAEALMDQRNLAGIGNVYKSETLFLRGISPWAPVGRVPDLPAVVELARQLLEVNKDRVDRVTTGSRARGEQSWVYGRAGRPCRRCGTIIRQADQGPAPQ